MSRRESVEALEDARLRRYLMGGMPDVERQLIEDRIFADEEYFARAMWVESELLDALVCGELPAGEVEGVRRFFAESGQAGRIAIAAALAELGSEGEPSLPAEASIRRWIVLAAGPLVAVLAWIGWQLARMRGLMAGGASPSGPVFTVTLAEGGVTRVHIPSGARMVSVEIDTTHAGMPPVVVVSGRHVGTGSSWTQRIDAGGSPRKLAVALPTGSLPSGMHEILVVPEGSGAPVASYQLVVD
jgi:hypothetical protein